MTGEEVKYDQRFNIVRKRVHSSTSVEYFFSFDDAVCSFFSNILRPAGGVNHPDSVSAKVGKLAAKKALR